MKHSTSRPKTTSCQGLDFTQSISLTFMASEGPAFRGEKETWIGWIGWRYYLSCIWSPPKAPIISDELHIHLILIFYSYFYFYILIMCLFISIIVIVIYHCHLLFVILSIHSEEICFADQYKTIVPGSFLLEDFCFKPASLILLSMERPPRFHLPTSFMARNVWGSTT